MTFFVCNSKASVQAWNQEADVIIFWNLANFNLVHTMAGFADGSFLLLNGQKHLRSVAEELKSNKKEPNEFIKNCKGTDIIKLSSQYFSTGLISTRRVEINIMWWRRHQYS